MQAALAGARLPLSDGGRYRRLPVGLGKSIAVPAMAGQPHIWSSGLAVRIYGKDSRRMLGRAEVISFSYAEVYDQSGRKLHGRVLMEEEQICAVSDKGGDLVARVFPDPEDPARFHVTNALWQELGSLALAPDKVSATVGSNASWSAQPEFVGRALAVLGQRIDPYLAGAAAFFFLLDPEWQS